MLCCEASAWIAAATHHIPTLTATMQRARHEPMKTRMGALESTHVNRRPAVGQTAFAALARSGSGPMR